MVVDALSAEVKRLILAVGSIEAIDVLLLLAREPERYWSARTIASESPARQQLEPTLERLAHLGLVDVRLGNDLLYRYLAASKELDVTVRQLAHESEERRFLVLGALASAASSQG